MVGGVKKLLPRRTRVGGTTPGIHGAEALAAREGSDQWMFKRIEPTSKQMKLLLAAVIAIAIKEVFSSHVYKFLGRVYLQLSGGAIGLRLMSISARIRIAR